MLANRAILILVNVPLYSVESLFNQVITKKIKDFQFFLFHSSYFRNATLFNYLYFHLSRKQTFKQTNLPNILVTLQEYLQKKFKEIIIIFFYEPTKTVLQELFLYQILTQVVKGVRPRQILGFTTKSKFQIEHIQSSVTKSGHISKRVHYKNIALLKEHIP